MPLFRQEVLEKQHERLHGEVMITQPLQTRVMIIFIFTVLIVLIIFLVTGSYARTEAVQGVLVTNLPSAKIMASTPGVINTLTVKEGMLVHKGDRLGVVDTDKLDGNGTRVGQGSIHTLNRRLMLSRRQVQLASDHQNSERARLLASINSARLQIDGIRSQVDIQKEIVLSNKRMFDQLDPIVAKGFVSKVQYENKRQAWLGSKQQLGVLEQQRLSIQSEQVATRALLISLPTDTERLITDIKTSEQSLDQQRAEVRGAKSYSLIAPISGRVTALQVNPGSAARVNIPQMVIVPDHSTLRAEIYAPSRAIGFVRPRQEVRLLYDAFPYQQFGGFTGNVVSVSRTIIDPRELDVSMKIEEPVYRITVALQRQYVDAYGGKAVLQPGMTVTGNIIIERQSFFSWLISPINAVLNRN